MACESETPVSKITYSIKIYRENQWEPVDIENPETTILSIIHHPENTEDAPVVTKYIVNGQQLTPIKSPDENK